MDSSDLDEALKIVPEFPRTVHLPWRANATRDDLIASEEECRIIFESPNVQVTEKVDGANVGMALGPVIRNRNHVLRKGYNARTPAKMQFSSIWNWYYEHEKCFEKLEGLIGRASVYGEWLYARHSVEYDKLPDFFLAFDVYSVEAKQFLDPAHAQALLIMSRFPVVPELYRGTVRDFSQLEKLAYAPSELSSKARREGVYIKVGDGNFVTHRFKMVREGFIQGEHWNKRAVTKNRRTGG